LWRSRATPIFEGGWCCSPECTRAQVEMALRRELGSGTGMGAEHSYRHRIPLGLSMLEKGWITAADLRAALDRQRVQGHGRLGEWLMRAGVVDESLLARALGLQWSCPVLALDGHDGEAMALLMPRLIVEAMGVLPLRMAGERMLYLGFEGRPDPIAVVAMEKMTSLRVEGGVVEGSGFRRAMSGALKARFAPVELVEAASESALARALVRAMEKAEPAEARLVRMHDFLWLRMWKIAQRGAVPRLDEVSDLVGSIPARGGAA
jgi:hypothetical protein